MKYLSDVEVVYRSLPSGWTLVFGPVRRGWWYLGAYAMAGITWAVLMSFESNHHSWWLLGPAMFAAGICVFSGLISRKSALAVARASSESSIRNLEQVWARVHEIRSARLEENLRTYGDAPLSHYVQWVDERIKRDAVFLQFPRFFTQGLSMLAGAALGYGVPRNPLAVLAVGLLVVLAATGMFLAVQLPESLKRNRWRDLQYLLRLIQIRQGVSDAGQVRNERGATLRVSQG